MTLIQIAEEGESQKDLSEAIITTGFIEWCARQLAEPAAGGSDDIQSQTSAHEISEPAEFDVNIHPIKRLISLNYFHFIHI